MPPEELKAFKEAYCKAHGGKYNLEVSKPYLEKLANGYLEKCKVTDDWTDILKVEALVVVTLNNYLVYSFLLEPICYCYNHTFYIELSAMEMSLIMKLFR